MMKVYKYPDKGNWEEIMQRPATDYSSLEKSVKKILQKVKDKGDKAIRKFSKEFDGASLKRIQVSEKEINTAASLLPEELKQAIQQACCSCTDSWLQRNNSFYATCKRRKY